MTELHDPMTSARRFLTEIESLMMTVRILQSKSFALGKTLHASVKRGQTRNTRGLVDEIVAHYETALHLSSMIETMASASLNELESVSDDLDDAPAERVSGTHQPFDRHTLMGVFEAAVFFVVRLKEVATADIAALREVILRIDPDPELIAAANQTLRRAGARI